MVNAGTVVAYLDMDTSKYSSALKTAGSQLKILEDQSASFGAKLAGLGSSLKTVGAIMAVGFTVPLAAAGAAGIKLASDFNESLNKVNTVFGESSGKVEAWSKKTLEASGIAQGTALDMSALFGDMAVSMGLPEQKAADMSMSLVGLAGDMASFKNISIDRAQTALAGVFTGETEALKGLGIVMTQANLEAFALAQGIQKPIKEMTQGELVALRYAYVMDVTKTAQGDFAKTSDGAANQMRIFQESIKELGASFGQHLLPIFTPVIQKLNETLKWFGGLDEGTKKTIVTIGGVVAAIGPLLLIFGQLASAVGAIMGLFTAAAPAVAGVGAAAGVTAAPIAAVGTAIGSVIGFATSVLAPIAAVGAAIYLLYKNSETFRTGALATWEAVKTATKSSFEFIKAVISGGLQFLKDLLGVFKAAFSGDWDKLWVAIKTLLSNSWENFKNIFSKGFDALKSVTKIQMEVLKTVLSTAWEGAKKLFATAFDGIKTLITQKVPEWGKALGGKISEFKGTIADKVSEWGKAVLDWISEMPGKIVAKLSEWGKAIVKWTKEQDEENKKQFKAWGEGIISWFKSIPGEIKAKLVSWKDSVVEGFINMRNGGIEKLKDFKTSVLSDLSEMPGKIKAKLDEWGKAIVSFFTGLGKKQEIKDSGKNMVTSMVQGSNEKKQDFMDNLGKMIVNGFKYALAFAGVAILATGREIVKQLIAGVKEGIPKMLQIGKDIVQGVIDGIQARIGAVKAKASELAGSIPGALKSLLKIQSPSKVTTEIGQFVGEGLVKGMQDMKMAVGNKSKELADNIGEALGKVKEYVTSTVSLIEKQYELWRLKNNIVEGSSEDLAKKLEVQKAKHESLNVQIANTQKALAQIIAKYGESSSEALKYKNELLDLQIEQANLSKNIDKTSGSLRTLASTYKYVGQVMNDGSIYQGKNSSGQDIYMIDESSSKSSSSSSKNREERERYASKFVKGTDANADILDELVGTGDYRGLNDKRYLSIDDDNNMKQAQVINVKIQYDKFADKLTKDEIDNLKQLQTLKKAVYEKLYTNPTSGYSDKWINAETKRLTEELSNSEYGKNLLSLGYADLMDKLISDFNKNSLVNGYATGTNNAARGWHMVGEEGPELMWFNGGERVLNNTATMDMLSGLSNSVKVLMSRVQSLTSTAPVTATAGTNISVHVHDNVFKDGNDAGEKIANALRRLGL